MPNLYAVRPFSANAKSKSSVTGIRVGQLGSFAHVKLRPGRSHLLLFPLTLSCSVILTRSEPPTKPMMTFFFSSFNKSSISSDADCRLVSALVGKETDKIAHLACRSESAIDVEKQ